MRAYLHDNLDGDQRDPHESQQSVSVEQLAQSGVHYRCMPNIEDVDKLAAERRYRNRDIVNVTEEGLGGKEAYEQKLKIFYNEHLHEDEEIRYILDGEGFFDVRDRHSDQWIRILVEKADLLIVPAGIYHRFTPTRRNYIKALRLFQEEPKWEAKPRPLGDDLPIRSEYLQNV